MSTKASVIISFYNNIRALQLILTALEQQDCSDFEVIIADDGSKPEIVEQINAWKNNFSYPLKHIWHEDKGIRKNRILNKAIIRLHHLCRWGLHSPPIFCERSLIF